MASNVKWLKLMNNMFEDDKIEYIESLPDGDTILLIWIKVLCLASKSNTDGTLMITDELPYTPALMAHKFKKTSVQVEYALSVMQKLGMIEVVDNIICVSNWSKYQSVDELAKIREQTRLRVAKCRENKKMIECNATRNATVTKKCNENALTSNSISKSNKFIKPTLEEVIEYCKERNNNVNAEKFIDYYSSNGWKVGKNSMKDWKAAIRTWEKNDTNNQKPKNIIQKQNEEYMKENGDWVASVDERLF